MEFDEIGIIGFGSFGQYLAKDFSKITKVCVTSRTKRIDIAKELGVQFVSLDEICSKKIIIISVAMDAFEETLNSIKDKIKPNTLVIDMCSLKKFSCDLMEKKLDSNISIVGCHPLFGPNSAPLGFKDKNLVLCNVRCFYFNDVISFFEKLEPKIFIKTADEHDEEMAHSQALTHFIGRTFELIEKNKNIELRTKTFDDLMNIVKIINNDSESLFYNMQKLNPHSKKVRQNFISSMNKLNDKIEDYK